MGAQMQQMAANMKELVDKVKELSALSEAKDLEIEDMKIKITTAETATKAVAEATQQREPR